MQHLNQKAQLREEEEGVRDGGEEACAIVLTFGYFTSDDYNLYLSGAAALVKTARCNSQPCFLCVFL